MPDLSAETLSGGSLASLVRERMLHEAARAKFDKTIAKPDKSLVKDFERVMGWAPSDEIIEWSAVAPAYHACFEEISDVWMIGGNVDWVRKLEKKLDKAKSLRDLSGISLALTGLDRFGDDPSGDSCFLNTLPDDSGLASVHVFNHETGELEGPHHASIAAFVARTWGEDDDEAAQRAVTKFNAEAEKRWKKRPVETDPLRLWTRARWAFEIVDGKVLYAFAEKLAQAPAFEEWEAERKRTSAPLAAYWVLAHYFLGNDKALAEAIARGEDGSAGVRAARAAPAVARRSGAAGDAGARAREPRPARRCSRTCSGSAPTTRTDCARAFAARA